MTRPGIPRPRPALKEIFNAERLHPIADAASLVSRSFTRTVSWPVGWSRCAGPRQQAGDLGPALGPRRGVVSERDMS